MVRAPTSHQCGRGSNPSINTIIMWVEFVVGSQRFLFSGSLVFPSPQKPTIPNFTSTRNQVVEEPLCGCATSKSIFISLFIIATKKDKQVNNVHCISDWTVKLDSSTSFFSCQEKGGWKWTT